MGSTSTSLMNRVNRHSPVKSPSFQSQRGGHVGESGLHPSKQPLNNWFRIRRVHAPSPPFHLLPSPPQKKKNRERKNKNPQICSHEILLICSLINSQPWFPKLWDLLHCPNNYQLVSTTPSSQGQYFFRLLLLLLYSSSWALDFNGSSFSKQN